MKRGESKGLDFINRVFGRLTVISIDHIDSNYQKVYQCRCICGNVSLVKRGCLQRSDTKSCGCLNTESRKRQIDTLHKTVNKTHGKTNSKAYKVWQCMKSRCTRPSDIAYPNYGGRGITFCKEWSVFENFYRDMGDPPKNHSIGRKDNNGNYSKDNCRWENLIDQHNNTRVNRFIDINGTINTVAEWARISGINPITIRGRLNRGWTPENAVFSPTRLE